MTPPTQSKILLSSISSSVTRIGMVSPPSLIQARRIRQKNINSVKGLRIEAGWAKEKA
jgi:hypothetical protein